MVKMIAAIAGYIEVLIAVIIVIADSYAHAVADSLKAGLHGNILKRAIFTLMVEAIPLRRPGFDRYKSFRCRIENTSPIDQENVEQAIVVIVEHRDSGTHGFDQVLAGRMLRNCVEVQP